MFVVDCQGLIKEFIMRQGVKGFKVLDVPLGPGLANHSFYLKEHSENKVNKANGNNVSSNSNTSSIERSSYGNETLIARASVYLTVEANLPLKSHITAVIGFLPIRTVITQLGAVIAGNILKILSGVFADKLLKDYESRKSELFDSVTQNNLELD